MRSERNSNSQGDFDVSRLELDALKRKRDLAQDYSRGKKKSHRKRASVTQKVSGMGHRRQRKWSW